MEDIMIWILIGVIGIILLVSIILLSIYFCKRRRYNKAI